MKKLLLIVKFFFIIFFGVIYYTSAQTQEEEKKAKNILDIIFCKKKNSFGSEGYDDIYPRLRKNLCGWSYSGVEASSYQEYLKFYKHKRICFKKKLNQVGSLSDCYPENEIYYVKYDGNNFIIDPDQTKKGKKDPEKNNDDLLTNKSNDDLVQQLKILNELYKSGVLTKEDFENAKKKVLD